VRLTKTVACLYSRLAYQAIGIAIAASPVMSQGIITTLAGSPTSCSYTGDGGPAAAATFCGIQTPATDSAGNIYFADSYRIRRIGTDGIVNTIAGNGTQGTSGDGGPALSATIGTVYQIAIYGTRLCFGDNTAYKIRCIDLSSGYIYGYGAGTSGTGGDGGNVMAASFMAPWGAAFDDTGNLYVGDNLAYSVRRVDPSGTITMFVGPGPGYSGAPLGDGGPALGANIYQPRGLYYRNGGLYIADAGNYRVRRVDLATGLISTVAGNGTLSYPGDGSSALMAGILPSWIVADPAGNLFLTDEGSIVRQVNTAGIMTTVANPSGNGGIGADYIPATQTVFNSIRGLGWDPVANRLLISDGSTRIRQIFYTPPTTTTLITSPNPANWNQTVTLTASVSPVDATGSFRFYESYPYQASIGVWSYLGSAPIVNGAATFTWTTPIGDSTYALSAVYAGDPTQNLSQSPIVSEVVKSGSSSVALTSSASPATQGQSITFTATITPFDATGAVTFLNGGTTIGSSLVSGGTATFTTSSLAIGSNSISASYSGDSRYAASTSSVLPEVVKAISTTTLTATPNPSVYNAAVTLTATVVPSSATGSVQFFNGATLLGTATLSGSQAQFSVTSLPVGPNSLTAVYAGDSADTGSTSAAVTQTVNKQTSTVTVTSSANPAPFGQSVTLTAAVSPSQATGTVQFLDGSTSLGTAAVNSGSATLSVSSLSVGDHSIVASYSGDSLDTASTSAVLTLTVNKAASSATVTSSLSPSVAGQSVTFTATVVPSSATGTVQFLDGATAIGSAALSSGTAVFATSTLAVGDHSVTASYLGDGSFSPSQSASILQQVVKRATATTLASTPNPSTVRTTVTLTATVSPSSATGTVQFLNGATVLGSAALATGSAQIAVSNLPVGSNSLTAVYGGDGTNAGSTSAAVVQTVGKANSTTALAGPASPLNVGQSAAFTATVTPSSATGTVQFLDGALAIGTAAVSGGTAVFSTTALAAGNHSITAAYSGDGVLNPSTSAAVAVQIVKIATTTTLTTDQNPSLSIGPLGLTAMVSPAAASGTVQFYDGAVLLGSNILVRGQAFLSVPTLTAGVHMLTAVYGGDATYAGSTSPAVRQQVSQVASTTTISASPAGSSTAGQTVTFTATVAPSAATGSVQFIDGNTVIGTAALVNGVAAFSTSALKSGNHSMTASYLGDINVVASVSAKLTYKVKP
jgi:hypothetical protein